MMNCFCDHMIMDMTFEEYANHCRRQTTKEGSIMCAPISAIRGKTADELLRMTRQEESIPIDLDKLLKSLRISCKQHSFGSIASQNGNEKPREILGALVTNGNNAIIYYKDKKEDIDKKESHRYRFTIAHELAHCCLSHYNIGETSVHFRIEGDPLDEDERAANIFAGELLIPEDSLRKVIQKLMLPSVHSLADIFEVSDKVMHARIKHLQLRERILGYNC